MGGRIRAITAAILRILQLWRLYASMDVLWITRSPLYFVTCAIRDLLTNLAGAFAIFLLAESFGGIGGWSRPQIVFMLGYGATVGGLMMTFFSFNVSSISRRIGRGQMDHTLIQPLPVWMVLLTEGFMPVSGGLSVLAGLAIMTVGAVGAGIDASPAWLATTVLLLISSCTVAVSFNFIAGSAAFWSPRAGEEINTPTTDLMESLKSFPLDGVGNALLAGLMTVVPVGFVAWYPSRYLVGIAHAAFALIGTPVAALVFLALAAFVFRKGLRHYGQTGSQRYIDYGHRR
jgi:ABC-2 type transport system permease protein